MPETLLGPLMVDVAGLELSAEDREVLRHPLVGALILFTRNFQTRAQLGELIRQIRGLRPELLIAADYEGGRVQRFRTEFSLLPAMRRLGRLYDDDPQRAIALARDTGWLIGSELRAADIDLSLAPVLDVDGEISAVIGDRAFHSTIDGVCALASALVQGLDAAGMAATGKHYPGHGKVVADSHHALPVDWRSYDEIRATDIEPFARMIARGIPSIMMAHILYPNVDKLPASLSRIWIQQHLRDELGFDGAVFCDDLSMKGAAVIDSHIERAEVALEAGCDMLPVCNRRDTVLSLLDGLRFEPQPESSRRLEALRGRRPLATFEQLPLDARWQHTRAALGELPREEQTA